ncbi:M23 family metallopeptidase [Bacillus sp. JJ1764]|uniref:M23 family metallopeptidase n=1 Tax=Bacillus sp. JJ1764 TaxID=3122964 RepID=UPI002FFF8D91
MFFLNKASKSKKFLMLKTTAATVLAASVVAFSNGPVALATSSKTTTIYHVYLNGTYIGNVTDKEAVNQVVSEKVNSMKKSLNGLDFNFGSQVQFVPERVFQTAVNNQETLETLKNTLELKAEAAAIVIDGKPVVYVDSKKTADDVIHKLELQYVTEDQLHELEAKKSDDAADLTPLQENQTRLLDVHLSKEVSIEENNVAPDKILSLDEAATYLQKGTLEQKAYTVKEGDVLETIASQNGLTVDKILTLNPGLTADSLLHIGQQLNITILTPYVDVIVEKEVNQREGLPFAQQVVEDASMPKGETRVQQEGQNGERLATYKISEQNGMTIKKDQTSEQILKQPVNNIIIKGTKEIPSRGEGNFAWPTVGGYVSSEMGYRWGKMHKGIDIARPSNKAILAADNGVVVSAGFTSDGYGNKVIIDHGNGFRTLYGHMSSLNVHVGQTVSKGSQIGIMGATGDATGVHLHFEVYKNGSLENPLSYLR